MRADDDDDRGALDSLIAAVQKEVPPPDLDERILDHVSYRSRLEVAPAAPPGPSRRALAVSFLGLAAGLALIVWLRSSGRDLPILAEHTRPLASSSAVGSGAQGRAGPSVAVLDPCRERAVSVGNEALIDDFEDGDDAIRPLEGRAGFWRWVREIDAPGTAPALMPLRRSDASRSNRLAQHVKGGLLVDWGAAVEFNFRPSCYDASAFAGLVFQARGPGRIYVAPREVSVIPIAEGGTCDHDCHNPHVVKVDLEPAWRTYQVRWSDLRQRGAGKAPLDPRRLHSLAFLIRPEDTPYDVWLDDVRFLKQ